MRCARCLTWGWFKRVELLGRHYRLCDPCIESLHRTLVKATYG